MESNQSNEDNHSGPFNRLFVIGGKGCNADDFKEKFGVYGTIKNLYLVTDKKTDEFKGITYITYQNPSEAALAIEEMNCAVMGGDEKPLKVVLANDRGEGRKNKGPEAISRLYITVPKDYTEGDVRAKFSEFGKIENIAILRHKDGASKGCGFVKYFRPYHAALAVENADASFKAKFASPPTQEKAWDERSGHSGQQERNNHWRDHGYGGGYGDQNITAAPNFPAQGGMMDELLKQYPTDGPTFLEVMAAPGVTRDHLYYLLNMTPGMDYCDIDRESGVVLVQYRYPQLAAFAKENLACLEYPPGYRIAVRHPPRPAGDTEVTRLASLASNLQSMDGRNLDQNDLLTLRDTIDKATSILSRVSPDSPMSGSQSSLHSPGGLLATPVSPGQGYQYHGSNQQDRQSFCSVPLPPPQPLADRAEKVAERLFVVSQPDAFSQEYLQDAMCRFGNLIHCTFMPGRNFGYVKYATVESADEALKVLHEARICGMKFLVQKADPPKAKDNDKDNNKRQKTS